MLTLFGSFLLPALGTPTYNVVNLGLTGPFDPSDSTGYTTVSALNGLGDVTGWTLREANNSNLGRDAWIYKGASTQQIGLLGPGYQTTISSGISEFSVPSQINNLGQVVGESSRSSGTGTDAFFFNGTSTQQVGLTGPNYEYTTSNGTGESVTGILQLNNDGEVAGETSRYSSTGTNLGQDAWFFNGSSTQQIGFTGAAYGYTVSGNTHESSTVRQMNDAGQVVGISDLYSAATQTGADAWLFSNGSTVKLGLTGANYATGTARETSSPQQINASGEVIGTSTLWDLSTNEGDDAWIYNGQTIQQIGLTGAGYTSQFGEQSTPIQLTNSGKVIGTSQRLDSNGDSLGQDSWIFNGTSTKQIGLTGAGFQSTGTNGISETSVASVVNNAGDVAGTSNINGNYGGNFGQDAWFFNGSSTVQIGLNGPNFTYTNQTSPFHSEGVGTMNASGDVIGSTLEYLNGTDLVGSAGWFFDPTTDTTIPLDFSTQSSNGAWLSAPQFVTDSGVVFGTYELYNGSTDEGIHGFVWSEGGGFQDLGVNSVLAQDGFTSISNLTLGPNPTFTPDGFPAYVLVEGTTQSDPYGESYALLSIAVPEPTSGILMFTSVILIVHRNRKCSSRPA